jgi:hypothetical protein
MYQLDAMQRSSRDGWPPTGFSWADGDHLRKYVPSYVSQNQSCASIIVNKDNFRLSLSSSRSDNMFDSNHIIRQPVLLATFAIAIPAWIIAFIAQAIAEARYGYSESCPDQADPDNSNLPVCRFLWFSIWVEM